MIECGKIKGNKCTVMDVICPFMLVDDFVGDLDWIVQDGEVCIWAEAHLED